MGTEAEINLEFEDRTTKCAGLEEMFQRLLESICHEEGLEGVLESLTIVSDQDIRELNLKYRKTDRATDVLSFSFEEGEDEVGLPFKDLGEVVISLDTAKRQAEEFHHPTCRELAFLFIHGTLHNLGYDHARSHAEATLMFDLQNKILNAFAFDWEQCVWPKD